MKLYNMRRLILLVLLAVIMVGCSDAEYARIATREGFGVATFDSCEYVLKVAGHRGFFAHKGNCKYCEKRDSIKWEKRKAELIEELSKEE